MTLTHFDGEEQKQPQNLRAGFQYFYVSPFLMVKTLLNYLFCFFPVVFSSMTSLQKEEFFDLVATAQARRLDDQRAQLGSSLPRKPKSRSFRGSLKQLTIVRKPEPVPVPKNVPAPKDDLYDMILTTQVRRICYNECCNF